MGKDLFIEFDEDIRLMLRAQKGDRQAYARLYEKYVPIVGRYVAAHNGRAESPEDLVQETFTRVWEHRDRYRPGTPVCSYLLGFAQNVVRECQVRERRAMRVSPPPRDPAAESRDKEPESAARQNDLAERLCSHLARLPARQRQAVELVYLAQMSAAEAAQIMRCSKDALRHSLCHARRRLQQSLFRERTPSRSL